MLLSLACVLPLMMLSVIGWWIGRFYKLKFGESSHSWILLVGGLLGSIGLFLHTTAPAQQATGHPLMTIASEVMMLLGGLLVAGGAFWLWYLLMGARR